MSSMAEGDHNDHDMVDLSEDPVHENMEKNEGPLQKKSRKKTSKVCNEFEYVKLKDGKQKLQCIHCKSLLALGNSGSTSHLLRHLDVYCLARQTSKNKQQILSLKSMGFEGTGSSLTTYKFDKEKVREILAKIVIVHEYPFRMVEHEFFVLLLQTLNPKFEKVSRHTVRNDCMKIFIHEKQQLKCFLENVEKVSLTADLWTPNQTIGYMCLTGHYVDSEWKLQKRILNFTTLPPPHTGIAIADKIFQCLLDWGIENKVTAITLDNASSNDSAVRNLKDNFRLKGKLFFKGKIFHVRCCAHVLNMMVQDGLVEIHDVIANVRESVKYLKMSSTRLHKFREVVKQLKLPTSKQLILDVPTRWNSTYVMLEAALFFKEVFSRYKERDPCFVWLPSDEDWERAQEVCNFLKVFNEATNIFSGSSYPTSNLFLPEIWKIKQILHEKSKDDKVYIKEMVFRMNEKFNKYWGDCNLLMSMAAVLDPRYKMRLIEFCFPKIYPSYEVDMHVSAIRAALYELYNDYVSIYSSNHAENQQVHCSESSGTSVINGLTSGRAEFENWVLELDNTQPAKSDLEVYLEEGRYICKGNPNVGFSALEWWKLNTLKFRILSNMARDILSISITSVASESAFSAGGRVLDQYRSSLKPETVEAILCAGDWLRQSFTIENPRNVDDGDIQAMCLE